jgi:hypothetical protein
MAMTIGDLEEKLLLARAAAAAAFQNRDFAELIRRKEETHALNELLAKLRPAKVSHATRRRGRKPLKFDRVLAAMRADLARGEKPEDLADLTEKELAGRYGASRDTCRRARDHALSENVEN